MKHHFETLGLQEGASQEEIQAAYERLSKELDPENNDNQEFFKEEYKKVQEAYDVLYNSSILASDKVKIENTDKIPESSKNVDHIQKPNSKQKKKSFFSKENAILVLLIILIGHSFYLQTKVSEATKYAKRAASNAEDASDYASRAASNAEDAYRAAFGYQCSYCPR